MRNNNALINQFLKKYKKKTPLIVTCWKKKCATYKKEIEFVLIK